jgi:hypothetical protein
MATITPSRVVTPLDGPGLQVWKWTGISAGDTIVPFEAGHFADKTVYFTKATAFGGSLSLLGSPQVDVAADAYRRYVTLSDPNNNPLSGISTETAEAIQQNAYFIKPDPGAGVASVDVYLLLSSPRG